MEFGRRIGLLPKPEGSEYEVKRWEKAFLGKSLFQQDVYVALLALRDDISKEVHVLVNTDHNRVFIDIPLIDHTPDNKLAQQAIGTTFFGEVVPEKYRAFATNEFNSEHLLAFLNRTAADVLPDEVTGWFYTTFGVEHLKRYGSVYIGSHGGMGTYGHDYNATIESISATDSVKGTTPGAVVDFARVVQRSLPHLRVEPLPVDTYLQSVQSTLKFLPKDWVN